KKILNLGLKGKAMAELKTKKNNKSPLDFIHTVKHQKRREDALILLDLMSEITGEEPKIWGTSIIGYGNYHYTYESGREGDWFYCGFSPRVQSLSLYLTCNFDTTQDLLQKLGKYKTGKACLYINKLEDIDIDVLKELIKISIENTK